MTGRRIEKACGQWKPQRARPGRFPQPRRNDARHHVEAPPQWLDAAARRSTAAAFLLKAVFFRAGLQKPALAGASIVRREPDGYLKQPSWQPEILIFSLLAASPILRGETPSSSANASAVLQAIL